MHAGDAVRAARREQRGAFDLIFVDLDKPSYPAAFRKAVPRLRPVRRLVADNVLWHGRVATRTSDPSTRARFARFNRLLYSSRDIFPGDCSPARRHRRRPAVVRVARCVCRAPLTSGATALPETSPRPSPPASRTRRHRLPVMVLHVTPAANTPSTFVLLPWCVTRVAVLVHVPLPAVCPRIRLVSDGHEHAFHRQHRSFAGVRFRSFAPSTAPFSVSTTSSTTVRRHERRLRILPRPVQHDFSSRAKFLAPVDQVHAAGEARRNRRFLHRCRRRRPRRSPSHEKSRRRSRTSKRRGRASAPNRGGMRAKLPPPRSACVRSRTPCPPSRETDAASGPPPSPRPREGSAQSAAPVRMFSISSGPRMPSGNPEEFSTIVVSVSCRARSRRSSASGFRPPRVDRRRQPGTSTPDDDHIVYSQASLHLSFRPRSVRRSVRRSNKAAPLLEPPAKRLPVKGLVVYHQTSPLRPSPARPPTVPHLTNFRSWLSDHFT